MLASKPAPAPVFTPSTGGPREHAFWPAMLAALGVSVCVLGWLYYGNTRLWGSWHGFLHAAIASRFSEAAFPPENPFFAGEPLPYYWFYHFTGYWLSKASRMDLLHTFHAISWISLAVSVLLAGRIGRMCFRSNMVGVAIAWLALVAVNPLGPAIAVAKHWSRGTPLVQEWPSPVETIFVTNQAADDLMSQPLLGAMYIGADWRQGQNLVWFFDIGSRAPALAGILLLGWLLLKPGGGWGRYAAIAAVSAVVTAFNPLVGLGASGALTAASVLTRRSVRWVGLNVVCLAGAVAALPFYWQIFGGREGSRAMLHASLTLPVVVVFANFFILLPLAIIGARRGGYRMATIVLAAALLLLGAIAVRLPEGNEHNLVNVAQCLLAIPAGAAAASRRVFGALLLVFLPVTAGTLTAFAVRPPMPIAMSGGALHRTPENGEIARLYEWIGRETQPRSIFITDPDAPVKMSGNVSELPAFTARTLFTDAPSYLTTPNRDAAYRAQLARQAVEGKPLTAEQRGYLARFGRAVYVLSFREDAAAALTGIYGPPAFRSGMAGAFLVTGGRHAE